ncbi:alkaline phosphatase family protein [Halococcus hamelinensis]|nr:alkaline phosphatase family protein [Halococcus hamelinensis]
MNGQEFIRQALGNAGSGIGWLAGQDTAGVSVAGVHIHILDHVGHLYADRPNKLRSVYDAIDRLVGWLKKKVDKLLIVSDHGMQTTETDDRKPGVHSWRAMISSTESGDLPKSVFDVREWIEQHTVTTESHSEPQTDVAAPREHLEDLGYL